MEKGGGRLGRGKQGGGGREEGVWRGSRSKDWRFELQEQFELDMEEAELD